MSQLLRRGPPCDALVQHHSQWPLHQEGHESSRIVAPKSGRQANGTNVTHLLQAVVNDQPFLKLQTDLDVSFYRSAVYSPGLAVSAGLAMVAARAAEQNGNPLFGVSRQPRWR